MDRSITTVRHREQVGLAAMVSDVQEIWGGGGSSRHLTVAATKEKTIKNTKPKHNVQGKNLY